MVSSYDLFVLMVGLECAMFPVLYPTTDFTDTGIREHYAHLHNDDTNRVISDRARNWIFGYHGGHMNKWYFEGWLTDIANGKDTKFHLHVASMSDTDDGNTFYDGTESNYTDAATVGKVQGFEYLFEID